MLKLIKITDNKNKSITLHFNKKQQSKIYLFGKTTYSENTELVIKSSLIKLKNDYLKGFNLSRYLREEFTELGEV